MLRPMVIRACSRLGMARLRRNAGLPTMVRMRLVMAVSVEQRGKPTRIRDENKYNAKEVCCNHQGNI